MKNQDLYWMEYSIKLASQISNNSIHVAAILVKDNKLIASSIKLSWAQELINQLNKKKINKIDNLYLTIHLLNGNQNFELNNLLNKIKITNIFLGLPDPNLNTYLSNDPVLNKENIFRFPENLQEIIFEQNYNYYKNSKQNIKNNNYYNNNRITKLLKQKLEKHGLILTPEEIVYRKQIKTLSDYITNKYHMGKEKVEALLTNTLSEAFDDKYSEYDYSNDIRSINSNWNKNFEKIYQTKVQIPLNKLKILNIGVGGGNEAKELFLNCKNITFVDIASQGLKKIKELIPNSNIIKCRAENLFMIENNSYDLYISLRTYNSSFFDIEQAIKEAYRVLKHESIIIISISNGFLNSKDLTLISGIIIPKLNFVDIYRGLNIAKNISNILMQYDFKDIELIPTKGELYISAKVNKN